MLRLKGEFMTTFIQPVSLGVYLAKEGDRVEILDVLRTGAVIPEQGEALDCKTHATVLAFLQELQKSPNKGLLRFYHHDNPNYAGHVSSSLEGFAHPCSLEMQISFVQYKIGESVHGVRGASGQPPVHKTFFSRWFSS